MKSIKETVMNWQNFNKDWGTYWLYLGDFLDNFYKQPNLYDIIEEPIFDDDIPQYVKAFTAASCELLCSRFKFVKPSWLFKEEYYLERPWFSGNTKGPLRCFLLIESPEAFKSRNLFVSEKVLDRC